MFIQQRHTDESAAHDPLRSSRSQPGEKLVVRQQSSNLIRLADMMNDIGLSRLRLRSMQDQIVKWGMHVAVEEHPWIFHDLTQTDGIICRQWVIGTHDDHERVDRYWRACDRSAQRR